jgi:hypothetical protein
MATGAKQEGLFSMDFHEDHPDFKRDLISSTSYFEAHKIVWNEYQIELQDAYENPIYTEAAANTAATQTMTVRSG